MRIASLLVLGLAAASLASCHDPVAPDAETLPLAMRVSVARDLVTSGDTVTVRLVARNLGPRTLTIDNPRGCLLGVELENQDGAVHETMLLVPPGACPAPNATLTIAPHDSLVEVRTWEAGVLVGGDVLAGATPGVWMLRPILYAHPGQETEGLYLPATVTVLPR